jgi:hypothetical protein
MIPRSIRALQRLPKVVRSRGNDTDYCSMAPDLGFGECCKALMLRMQGSPDSPEPGPTATSAAACKGVATG